MMRGFLITDRRTRKLSGGQSAQIDAGLAWWYRKYAHEQHPGDRVEYESAEDRAAADRIGLWQDKNPVPPWEWRREHR